MVKFQIYLKELKYYVLKTFTMLDKPIPSLVQKGHFQISYNFENFGDTNNYPTLAWWKFLDNC